jgi:hypothetical protein
LPKARVDIRTIGKVMRIPCSMAVVGAGSATPGTNAETWGEPSSPASRNAVLNWAAETPPSDRSRSGL